MVKKKYKEEDIAQIVVEYLKSSGWDVYQEVPFKGSRADIVATNGNRIKVIEVKVRSNMTLLGQALNWLPYSNWVYIAILNPTGSHKTTRALLQFMDYLGIGVLYVYPNHEYGDFNPVKEVVSARLNRKIISGLFEVLKNFPKEYANAGTNGKYWTDFKATVKAIKDYLKEKESAPLKEIIKEVKHHYKKDSTAKSCICQYIRTGVIDGIGRIGRGNKVVYYLKEK